MVLSFRVPLKPKTVKLKKKLLGLIQKSTLKQIEKKLLYLLKCSVLLTNTTCTMWLYLGNVENCS